jgi:hypothetical protein
MLLLNAFGHDHRLDTYTSTSERAPAAKHTSYQNANNVMFMLFEFFSYGKWMTN